MGRFSYNSYPPYVSVAERKELAKKQMKKIQKNGVKLNPVFIEGRAIANTFWGKAWCKHIEKFQDYENRLPRGRNYLRSGTVIDLSINEGSIKGIVSGYSNYNVSISVNPIDSQKWKNIISACTGEIDSIVALLQGTFSKPIMEKMTDVDAGLFPKLIDVTMNCSCPDFAHLCKHIAAVLYGVANRLDSSPENLFTLRSVNLLDLLESPLVDSLISQQDQLSLDENLSDLFGIDFVDQPKKKKTQTVKKKISKT